MSRPGAWRRPTARQTCDCSKDVVQLTADFVSFARPRTELALREPKLALTLNAYARTNPILVLTTTAHVVDLGSDGPATPVLAV